VNPDNFVRVGNITLDGAVFNLWSAVIDPDAGFAYFADYTQQSRVAKIRLSDFTRVATLRLSPTDQGVRVAVIDTANNAAYFGTTTSPARVVKVDLATFTRIGHVTLNDGDNNLTAAVIDPDNGFAYFGTNTSPGRVVKVNLATFEVVATLTLDSGENSLTSAVIDTVNGYAYFGTDTSPGRVVKVDVNPSRPFARQGGITLSTGENKLSSAVIDMATSRAYFGTNTSPGRVIRVNINPGDAFATAGSHTVSRNRLSSAVIDPNMGRAYFGTQETSGWVVEVDLSILQEVTPALQLQSGGNYLTAAVIDTAKGCAYFGSGDSTAGNFGSGYNPPASSNRVMKVQTGACKDATATVLSASSNPSSLNQEIVFTAKVTSGAGTPTGEVVFSQDGSPVATRPLNNGVATFSTNALGEGEYVITAAYSGTERFEASEATRVQEVVDDRTATALTLNADPSPAVIGQQVVFTATVSAGAGTPSGNVVFSENGNTLATSPINNGVATFTTSAFSQGEHTIQAAYNGNNDFKPSMGTTTVTVTAQASSKIYLPAVTK
jgi:hypothetical protein